MGNNDTQGNSARNALAAKLEEIRRLPNSAREALISDAFVKCATSRLEGQDDYIPLFERNGVRDSQPLQALVVRLGTSYADLLLMQRANALHVNENGIYENPVFEQKDNAILKELSVFTEVALQQLQTYQPQLDQYSSLRGQAAAEKLLGSAIKVARERVLAQLTGFEVDSVVDREDPHIPPKRYLDWTLNEYYPKLRDIKDPEKRKEALNTIIGRKT